MYCRVCHTPIAPNQRFCHNCGALVQQSALPSNGYYPQSTQPRHQQGDYNQQNQYNYQPISDSQLEGHTTGIIALILAFIIPFVGFIVGIVGLRAANMQLREHPHYPTSAKTLNKAAIVISSISIIIFIIAVIIVITINVFMDAVSNGINTELAEAFFN